MTHSLTLPAYQFKRLILCNLIGALLFSSLFWAPTHALWQTLDVAFFKWANSSLKDRPMWQLFWACANHKWADWLEDVCILIFFTLHVRSMPSLIRPRKIAELICSTLYLAAIIFFINGILFREHLSIPRISPTLFVDDAIRLSREIPWMSIKDSSSKSFPGDHGTTALLFAAFFAILAKKRLAIPAIIYAAFLCMPRLITGAHWLSDILVGSGTITLITLSWMFCTPLFTTCSACVEKGIKKLTRSASI